MEGLYKKLLWFMGFKTDETISAMLTRQKERLGVWWWIFPITTMVGTLALFCFQIWLTIHINNFKLED